MHVQHDKGLDCRTVERANVGTRDLYDLRQLEVQPGVEFLEALGATFDRYF